ncbi:hypothetical protein [Actinopolymorpha pittospori]|uniref:Uncharacterized protein n=1 Tax=Actinopolymorpha pittospori TaxID=648752 RepID=A0A927MUE2_9ACTN|nr:hypothetical protein [Actinopolymorpha pittospori]MBE1606536.1 hypothetical protein [Actinopolymorpha pittospori]
MTTHWIAVVGNSPGVGKSTLCVALASWLRDAGAVVDHFEEEHILTRAQFRDVAEEFAGDGVVHPRTLVAATRSYVEHARGSGVDVLVTDALIPFVPSLVAWGQDEPAIAEIIRDLERAVEPTRVTLVYLRDDPGVALQRAVDREGPAWAEWYVGKLGAAPGTRSVVDLASAAEHLRREADLTLRLLAASRWDVVIADAGVADAGQIARYVRERLRGRLQDVVPSGR